MSGTYDFPFSIVDVAGLLNFNVKHKNTRVWDVDCPFCGDNRGKLNINLIKNVFQCNYCTEHGGMLELYGKINNLTIKESYNEILDILKIGKSNTTYKMQKKADETQEICNSSLASKETIHKTYSELLSMLSLSKTHEEKLLERGLSSDNIKKLGYKSVPAFGYRNLVNKLINLGCEVKGVPGFYLDDDKYWSVNFNPKCSGIIVPIKSFEGLILAAQIRLDRPFNGRKYLWLSSVSKNMGVSCGSPIHFVGNPNSETIMITEGTLKGDIAHCLSGNTFACVAGVNQFKNLFDFLLKLKKNGLKEVYEVYDMDKLLNITCKGDYDEKCNMCEYWDQGFGKGKCLRKERKRENIRNGCKKLYEVCDSLSLKYSRLTWDKDTNRDWLENYKGIDDYYYGMKNGN